MDDNSIIKAENQTDSDDRSLETDKKANRNRVHLLSQYRAWFVILWKTMIKINNFIRQLFKADSDEESTIKGDLREAFSRFKILNTSIGGVLFLSILYLLSGIFVVNPGEKAVVKLFGKPIRQDIGEGIHYRMPWPIEAVDIVNIATIRREGIGLILPEHKSIHSSPEIIQFMTGDNNIIEIQAVVQYRVKNAAAFLYNLKYPAYQMVNETIRSAITEIGGNIGVDDILTIGKERLQELIRKKVQILLDQYNSGLQLVGINFNKVYPPDDVAEAFRDVSNANQDREKRVNDAWGYRNTIIPQARGDAVKIIREAEAYKISTINDANGEAGRFRQLLLEYNNERGKYTTEVTKTRLYLESMERILKKVKKYIVDPDKGGQINLRLLQK